MRSESEPHHLRCDKRLRGLVAVNNEELPGVRSSLPGQQCLSAELVGPRRPEIKVAGTASPTASALVSQYAIDSCRRSASRPLVSHATSRAPPVGLPSGRRQGLRRWLLFEREAEMTQNEFSEAGRQVFPNRRDLQATRPLGRVLTTTKENG